ncbi:MAG: LemA family protein [Candidatus Moranbacteria bacterium]|nr:LemA family protein [Candidatus Moranbacteria bacterium]
MIGVVVLIAVIGLASYLIKFYNDQIVIKNKVDEAWSDIDVQLKRRYDLIPNLVETVKGYAKHESSTLEDVTKARNMAMQATNPQEKAEAENFLSDTLKSLFAVSEQYPQLKADKNFLNLQNKLSEIEEVIQKSRRYYNGNVRDFNTKIQKFPNNIFAPIMGFKKKEFFKLKTEKERENVKVEF